MRALLWILLGLVIGAFAAISVANALQAGSAVHKGVMHLMKYHVGEARKVLTAFVQDGRLTSIPSSHGKRLVILDWLAQLFEPGRRYSEQMVNLLLGQRHADTAALRRYLVDEEFLTREDGIYWRSGGTVDPPTDAAGSGPG